MVLVRQSQNINEVPYLKGIKLHRPLAFIVESCAVISDRCVNCDQVRHSSLVRASKYQKWHAVVHRDIIQNIPSTSADVKSHEPYWSNVLFILHYVKKPIVSILNSRDKACANPSQPGCWGMVCFWWLLDFPGISFVVSSVMILDIPHDPFVIDDCCDRWLPDIAQRHKFEDSLRTKFLTYIFTTCCIKSP